MESVEIHLLRLVVSTFSLPRSGGVIDSFLCVPRSPASQTATPLTRIYYRLSFARNLVRSAFLSTWLLLGFWSQVVGILHPSEHDLLEGGNLFISPSKHYLLIERVRKIRDEEGDVIVRSIKLMMLCKKLEGGKRDEYVNVVQIYSFS